jgi:cytochrome bd ubiquinol oxidase subunit I
VASRPVLSVAVSQQTLVELSQWQWAITAGFHIIFPSLTVGTSMFLVVCYAAFMRTGREVYLRLFRLWRRIFAIGFGLGVVSGIVLTFEFGLNWGGFAHDVGPILGVIIGMEVVTAFFLEAGFLGLLIYGDGRISQRVMLFSACMVSLGTLLSVTWILAANSWMQTPAGYSLVNGQFLPRDWAQVILNPSFGWRTIHMLVGVLVSAAWFVTGISAWYLVRSLHLDVARRGLSIGLGAAAILIPVQMYLGDSVAADYVIPYQPPKLEALEGNWTSTNTGWNILLWPDQSAARNDWVVTIPWLGSAIAKDWSGRTPTPGLLQTPPRLRPMMLTTFYGFRLMCYAAFAMFATAMAGVILRLRRRLHVTRWFHRWLLVLTPAGPLAIIGGWVLAETGRQPWLVYGRLLTADAVSPLDTWQVLTSLALLILVYAALLGTYIWYVARVVRQGPEDRPVPEPVRAPVAPRPRALGAPRRGAER